MSRFIIFLFFLSFFVSCVSNTELSKTNKNNNKREKTKKIPSTHTNSTKIKAKPQNNIDIRTIITIFELLGRYAYVPKLGRYEIYKKLNQYKYDDIYNIALEILKSDEIDGRTKLFSLVYLKGREIDDNIKVAKSQYYENPDKYYKTPKKFVDLLSFCLKNKTPDVRAGILFLFPEEAITNERLKLIKPHLKDSNLVVRLAAVKYFINKEPDEFLLKIIFEGYTKKAQENNKIFIPLGGFVPPLLKYICDDLIMKFKNKSRVLEIIRNYKPKDKWSKYNLIDIYSYLTKNTDKFIYIYNDDPTPEVVRRLDEIASRILKNTAYEEEDEDIWK